MYIYAWFLFAHLFICKFVYHDTRLYKHAQVCLLGQALGLACRGSRNATRARNLYLEVEGT